MKRRFPLLVVIPSDCVPSLIKETAKKIRQGFPGHPCTVIKTEDLPAYVPSPNSGPTSRLPWDDDE